MRIALVHDWLTGMRGGERCLQAFLGLYPSADIFTLLHIPGTTSQQIDQRVYQTSFLNHMPCASKLYRHFLPLYPCAIKQFNFKGYDLIISLSHAAAKNVQAPKGVPHICYCFTPMRYIWDQASNYFGALSPVLWPALSVLRAWDRSGSKRVTEFVAISKFVAARIRCFYKRQARVIYPPVDASWIKPCQKGSKGEAFLYAGALVPYKRVDLVVQAFNQIGEKLWILGSGPDMPRLKALAKPNIEFIGWLPDQQLAAYYSRARALIFPAVEDFGIVPLEAMAAGRPVIGIYDGALRETLKGVKPWDDSSILPCEASGIFFKNVAKLGQEKQLAAVIAAVNYFLVNESQFEVSSCIEQAQKFSPQRFVTAWKSEIEKQLFDTELNQAYGSCA